MDLPKDIKFEFFLIILGLSPSIFLIWTYIYHSEKYIQLINNNIIFSSLVILIGGGLALFLIGFRELTSNYFRNKELVIMRDLIKKEELNKLVEKLPIELKEEIFPKKKESNNLTFQLKWILILIIFLFMINLILFFKFF